MKQELEIFVTKKGFTGLETLALVLFSGWPGREHFDVPEPVMLAFFSSSPDWVFLRSNDLDLLAGEERLSVRETRHDGNVRRGFVTENVSAVVTLSDIQRIIRGGKIRGRLGQVEFLVTPAGLDAAKTFAAAMAPREHPP